MDNPIKFGLVTSVTIAVAQPQVVPQAITGTTNAAAASSGGNLLLETGDKLVLEDGSGNVLLES